MPPVTNPPADAKGWWYDKINNRLASLFAGVRKFYVDGSGVTVPSGQTLAVAGSLTVTGTSTLNIARLAASAALLGLGTGEAVTIASGVATVTKSYVVLDAEGAGTTDQLDTITMANVAAGDLLLLTVNATDTITVDDANINLGAATRAVAPGGALLLYYDGTEWTELAFIAASDNV